MKKKNRQLEKIQWRCRRCGSNNIGNYICDGSYGKMTRNGLIRVQCRHTPIYNPLVSKYCLSVDHNKKHLGVKTFKEYLEMYA